MVDGEKVLTLALTRGGRQTPTVAVVTAGTATLVVRRRGVDYRAMAVDAREFTVTVPPGSLVDSDWAPDDAWMVMNVLSAEV